MLRTSDDIEIQPMNLDEVRAAVEWADREGWEPGLTDAEPFFAASPDGFHSARIGGDVFASISAVRCSPEVVFVGFYIVDPDMRGKGFGKRLWDEVLSQFADVTLGADAVPAQVANYESDGFHVAYGNARYSGTDLAGEPEAGIRMTPVAAVDFEALVEFDGRHYFGPRPGFLRLWIEGPGRDALVTTDESGSITGFAASRKSALGHRIGPVFADQSSTARSLILTLANKVGGRVAIDVPLPNHEGVDLLESFGMERGFETSRIYRGPDPVLPLDQIFGTTSLELG